MATPPLFRVPPELRIQIYTYCIGGHDIHVRDRNAAVSYSICTEPVSHTEAVRQLKALSDSEFPVELDHFGCSTHGFKNQPAQMRLNLQLLLTCQQVYQEANDLPFKTNTFVFSNPMQLKYVADTLLDTQRRAMASIALVTSYISGLPTDFKLGAHISMLSGLHHLVMALGIPNKTTPADVRAFLREAEECFGRHSLQFVDILIGMRAHRKLDAGELEARHREYVRWARETEVALLKSSEDP